MQENQSSSLPSVEAILGPALNQLNRTLKNVADKYEKLTDLDGALIEFNRSFGSFLFGIQANGKTIQWEHVSLIKRKNDPCLHMLHQGTNRTNA